LPSQQLTTFLLNPTTMRHRHPKTGSRTHLPLWHRFDSVRTKETGGDCILVLDNHVSLSIPAPWTHRDAVEKIASQSREPIPIQSLADALSETKFVRGKVIFGFAGDKIDQIASNYEDMHWWISKEGLNMAIVPPAATNLSRFDEFAGKLCVDKWKDGKLSKKSLMEITKKLDGAGFTLKELQPAQLRPISNHNQRNSRNPIKTFMTACLHGTYVRSVRRRLYVARERYMRANFPASPLPGVS